MSRLQLSSEQLQLVKDILRQHLPGIEVRAFGSRVSGDCKEWSDLDLVVMTAESLSLFRLMDVRIAFEESDLPFSVDLLDWQHTDEEFQRLIAQDYKVIQQANL